MMRMIALLSLLLIPIVGLGEDHVKIGVTTPLSGPAAIYGADTKQILLFANKEFANNQYELLFEDDLGSGKEAVTVAQKFINVNKLRYVIEASSSTSVLSSAPLYQAAEVLTIATLAGAPQISEAGSFIFRTFPNDIHAVSAFHKSLTQQVRNLGVVTEEHAFPRQFVESLQNKNQKSQMTITNESFLPTDTDFRTILTRLRSKEIDALFINSQSETTFLPIFQQAKQLGWLIPVYGAFFPGSPSFLKNAGSSANGITFVDLPSVNSSLNDTGKKLYVKFQQNYSALQGVPYSFITTIAAFQALHEAIQSGSTPRNYLHQTCFHGIGGDYAFDKNGDILGINMVMKKIVNGKPKLIASPAASTTVPQCSDSR